MKRSAYKKGKTEHNRGCKRAKGVNLERELAGEGKKKKEKYVTQKLAEKEKIYTNSYA